MPEVAYPSSLPGPVRASFQSAERRALSSVPGLRDSRVLSRDRGAIQPLDFVLKNVEQVQTWLDWGANELVDWGAWFSASWPQPQGGVGVRRFIGSPTYPEYLQKIGWRVSAQCQVRGRGILPMEDLSLSWDEADKSPLAILSDADRSVTIIDASFKNKWALCTLALGSGKWLFEIQVTGITGGEVDACRPALGLGTKGYFWGAGTPESTNSLPDDGSIVWTQSSELNAVRFIGAHPGFDTGDRLSFAADLDARKMWLYKNGVIVQGDPVAGTGHSFALRPAADAPLLAPLYWNALATASVTLITSPRQFEAAIPAGYTAWGN